jgi:hypothetical protein
MAASYLAPVSHVMPLTTIRRERSLPVPGTVAVRVNQKLQASDVMAEAEVNRKHMFLDVGRALGIPERLVARSLARQVGDTVEAGDILAGPVGWGRRTLRAPADGVIVALSRGRILFEARGETLSLRAGFGSTVVSTDGVQHITLETPGALIQVTWGNGKQDYGITRFVGRGPGDRMQTDQLDVNLRGAVLVAGVCENPAPLHQATELSVRGLILGSMTSELIPVAMRLPFPILLTEGFGRIPMNGPAYALLQSNAGREASLDGRMGSNYESQRPEVIIPLPANRQMAMPDDVVPLKPAVRVRVVRAPHRGAVGQVRLVLPKAVGLPSGILARSATVDLDGIGAATVPLANLEILQ